MKSNNIRNFAIISHIDHGKSTLADRFLELTKTIEKRKMREQYLDSMELERERGITIKMQPVRMLWRLQSEKLNAKNQDELKKFKSNSPESNDEHFNFYILNLIDTPGHIDFSYEVSRALAACEGAILLVDATQGVQAQTFTNIDLARSLDLTVIPAINKIDLPQARINDVKKEIIEILGCGSEEIIEISAKTGEGVENLLKAVIERIPPPLLHGDSDKLRALIFDFQYSIHKGIIAFVRMFGGSVKEGDEVMLARRGLKFIVKEVGFFEPDLRPQSLISNGEAGYIVTNVKEPSVVRVGDTVVSGSHPALPLPGYKEPRPVIWANIYPASQEKFDDLKKALLRLRLSDSAFSFSEEAFGVLGRGFKCGFLGMLHLEIISERIRREFNIDIVVTAPTVSFFVKKKNGMEQEIFSPSEFPESFEIDYVLEPWVKAEIIIPSFVLGPLMKILPNYEASVLATETFSFSRIIVCIEMPLRELMRGFFDDLKNISSGFSSLNYEVLEEKRKADVLKLEILIAEEKIPAFTRIIPYHRLQRDADFIVEKLKSLLPRALFSVKIQAKAHGRIIASRTLSALKKNVTGHLYGGDRSRKMKLWKKQKEGKKKLKEQGSFNIPKDVFVKMVS
jgi:GTP-binding protein LepA